MPHPRKIIIENNLVFVFKTVVYLNLKKHISNVFYALKLLCTKLTKTIRMHVMIQMLGFSLFVRYLPTFVSQFLTIILVETSAWIKNE